VGVLSLVVIACNEADRIGRCLDSVPWASEKVVLDSGSSDDTVEVAQRHGARVIQTDWPGFVAQKNRAIIAATQPWILSLDADEWLDEQASASLREALTEPGEWEGFSFPRCTQWLGQPLRHGRAYPDRQVRVGRAGRAEWRGKRVHERLWVPGPVRALDGDIGHASYRSLEEHLRTIRRYTDLAAADLWDAGLVARRRDVMMRPPLRFVDAYLLRAGFRDGRAGLAVAGLSALYTGMKWGKVWQRARSESR
jgi:glycosyltransferase involved in cell wall biosynthesis